MSINVFTLANVLRELEPGATPEVIIERLEQIDLGLSAEDEFQCILVWLGKCPMCHKTEQVPFVSSDFDPVKIPDIIAAFSIGDRTVTVAIEVKSTSHRKLSWSQGYYEKLSRYGSLTGLPVLVAWKHVPFRIWTLTDINAFRKNKINWVLPMNEAFRQNLLGVLAGELSYQLMDGVGLHLEARKDELVRTESADQSETWRLTITKAWFTDGNGKEYRQTPPGIWPLFLGSHLSIHTEVNAATVLESFVIDKTNEVVGKTQWLHRVLPLILRFTESDSDPISWRQKLLRNALPTTGSRLKDVLGETIGIFTKCVFEHEPVSLPVYLKSVYKGLAHE